MLSKLVKYDIKSLIRVFIPIWIVAPIVAVMLSGAIHLISVPESADHQDQCHDHHTYDHCHK